MGVLGQCQKVELDEKMSRCHKKLARQHLVQPQPGEMCLSCANPPPCPVRLHDPPVTIKYGKCNFYNTRKPHSCTPVYIQLRHIWNVINFQVLCFLLSILVLYRYIQRKCFWVRGLVRVFLIYESLEMLWSTTLYVLLNSQERLVFSVFCGRCSRRLWRCTLAEKLLLWSSDRWW